MRALRDRAGYVSIAGVDAWGGDMRVRIEKWGNSAAVRIPAQVMAAAAIRIDQAVDVGAEGGRIVIEAATSPCYDLDQLLAGMSPDTFPDLVDFGPEAGGEAW
ncbi:AbrB/MazE/SpoVT family DNA-binding domain-containing protein [Sphingomonas sanxanigenens]|uniref:SpoVT-AbrB domain-containing protein n=1 Tax=Sphingomonas sanxanigenens DSM 19645 = NX02 TaxID=1123269 RepID=W0ABM2_9SPHN|nr:AbrB/MazE/SpoVT family DNA-binding domain-containing protein [Sphingomonas sanxanigenens]AHE53050.1 hypothetical protein NX02_06600 [Sphingomonas sanxanigenens DSM 19645 = NX02]